MFMWKDLVVSGQLSGPKSWKGQRICSISRCIMSKQGRCWAKGTVQAWVVYSVLGHTKAQRGGHLSGYARKNHIQVKIPAIY